MTESDVKLAHATRGFVFSFSAAVPRPVRALARQRGVKIVESPILLNVVEHIEAQAQRWEERHKR